MSASSASPVFLGHTRFSIDAYGTEQFSATRNAALFGSYEEYRDWLYDDARLSRRLGNLLDWSLPQLQRAVHSPGAPAGGHRMRHVISYSPTLPEPYLARLRQAEEQYEFLVLNPTSTLVDPYAPPEPVMRRLLKEFRAEAGTVFATYRLDDDDVLAAGYFDQLAGYVHDQHVGGCVSFGLGFSGLWRQDPQGTPRLYHLVETHYPKVSMGLASVGRLNTNGSISLPQRSFIQTSGDNHTEADRAAPVLLDSQTPAFLRVLHPTQSGVLHNTREAGQHWYVESLRRVASAPPADMEAAAELFPAVAESLRAGHGEAEESQLLAEQAQVVKGGVSFEARVSGTFVLELEFDSEEAASGHALEVRWRAQLPHGFDPEAAGVGAGGTNLRFHSRRGALYSPLPVKGRYGARRHTVVALPEGVEVTGVKLVSRTADQPRISGLRITRIG